MSKIVLTAAVLAASLTSTPAAAHTIEVAIYDTVRLTPDAIATIQATVEAALEPAAITIAWTLCPAAGSDDGCNPARPPGVVVRLLPTHAPRTRGRCGYAVPEAPGRGFISLALDCAAETAGTLRRNWKLAHAAPITEGTILGYMLAHEFAHLLLDDTPHAATGLFKERLTRPDWSEVEHGRLTFGRQEVERLRAAAGRLSRR